MIKTGNTINCFDDYGKIRLSINGESFYGEKFYLTSAVSYEIVKINGKKYRGKIQISSSNNSIDIINILNLEDYVKGVLAKELPLGKSPPDPFYNIPYEYGVFFIYGAIWWPDILESEATADLSGAAIGRIGEKKYGTLLRSLPVVDLDKTVLGKEKPYWRKWIDHPTNDAYWERANFLERLKDINIPAFHQSGWFDGDGIGSKLNYLAMKAAGHPNQKLILGPWGHQDKATRQVGDLDFGSQALLHLPTLYLRWFDYWLKDIDNKILGEPPVRYFVMGDSSWREDENWPPSGVKYANYELAEVLRRESSRRGSYILAA